MPTTFHTYIHTENAHQIGMGIFEAVGYNNEANRHSMRGDYTTAETLHRRALEIKLAVVGPDAIQTALTYNALGETLFKLGRLNEAEAYLKDAVRIRRPERSLDTATSRENLARCWEALGRLSEAKELREEDPEWVACGNYYCPITQFGGTVHQNTLKACGRCKSVYYCDVLCQKADWKRHKAFCRRD